MFSVLFLIAVMSIVSLEVRALLEGIRYVRANDCKDEHRGALILLRYLFASALFHEAFASYIKQAPAYSVKASAAVFISISLLASLTTNDILPGEILGMATVPALTLFAMRYGRQFIKNRAAVARSIAASIAAV